MGVEPYGPASGLSPTRRALRDTAIGARRAVGRLLRSVERRRKLPTYSTITHRFRASHTGRTVRRLVVAFAMLEPCCTTALRVSGGGRSMSRKGWPDNQPAGASRAVPHPPLGYGANMSAIKVDCKVEGLRGDDPRWTAASGQPLLLRSPLAEVPDPAATPDPSLAAVVWDATSRRGETELSGCGDGI